MTTEELLTAVLAELKGIRAALEAKPAATAPRTAGAPQTSSTGDAVEIPQPAQVVENPGDVRVHFGKNNGVPLKELTANSLKFYASVKEAKLDSSGKPYPPRPQDTILENAARTLHHRNLGTLVGATLNPVETPAPKKSENLDEDVPF